MVSIDGTDISGATIDGTDVKEITVDGNVVWTPPIPDNAIHHWKMDEGTGSTAADSIGSYDGTMNSANWISNGWYGGHAVDTTSSGYVNVGTLGNFGSSVADGAHAVFFTMQMTEQEYFFRVSNDGGSGNKTYWGFGNNGAAGTTAGNLIFLWRDTNGNAGIVEHPAQGVDDGNKYRVCMNKSGTGRSSVDMWVNNNESSSVARDQSPGSMGDFNHDLPIGAYNSSGSYTIPDITMDNVIICNGDVTNQEIQDDYNNQPWT